MVHLLDKRLVKTYTSRLCVIVITRQRFIMKINLKKSIPLQFKEIIKGTTALDLELDLEDINEITVEKLTEVYSNIPAEVTRLKIAWDSWKMSLIVNGSLALTAIPSGVKNLDLTWNNLSTFTGMELVILFSRILTSTLNLSLNDLYLLGGDGLERAFSQFSPNLKFLYLDMNGLGSLPGIELVAALKVISETVSYLSLASNELGNLSIDDLKLVFKAIPGGTKTLNLINNDLEYKKGEGLEYKTDDQWIELLTELPKSVTEIIISDNPKVQKRIADIFNKIRIKELEIDTEMSSIEKHPLRSPTAITPTSSYRPSSRTYASFWAPGRDDADEVKGEPESKPGDIFFDYEIFGIF